MTLQDLKQRATASESALIEAVESALREDVAVEARRSLITFVNGNPPPGCVQDLMFPGSAKAWMADLTEHMNPSPEKQ